MTTSFLSMRPLRYAMLSLSVLAFAPSATAAPPSKSLKPRALVAKPTGRELAGDTLVERIVVKFHEGSRVRLRDQRLVALTSERDAAERSLLAGRNLGDARLEADVGAVASLLERAPRIGAIARLFDEPESSLEARKASGERQSGEQLADLNLYFEVPLMPGTTSERVADLVAALNALDGVEVAYAEPPPEPAMVNFGMDAAVRGLLAAADLPPTTPSYVNNQGYLNAAPNGVNAKYAWTVTGGQGQNVKVVDVEGGWRTTHEDMPTLFHMGGTQYADASWRHHGTAVLGEIVGASNAYGVTGIAHAAQAGYESIGAQSSASAISKAATAAGRGGIVLIELHSRGPADGTACTCNTSQCNYIAMEYWQANYDAIKTATANGVIVVEAAGNGSADLDASAYGGRFNRNTRDSEAIVVGGSTATTRSPMCWTNFGTRVDVHGWGERVYSMGYGNVFGSYGEDQFYTSSFSGTSSASPIVVGAAASAQGVALANGRRLTSAQMRSLLRDNGTPQAANARQIGPLPDLAKALPKVISGNY
ncbi:S8 family peptidase [Corallococcus macrosporus]|uniref:Peptidase S8 n=2 Tax=Myxococcaceae TaxID=31 RepID=A0A250JRW0_9BACT|nr:S8 family peptidase [Corallococcus macrosporus]AEI65429.1 S8 family peptidase [Corallococcus macrosporus]ATB46423.1 peptidase S8 [Corallococcus macrosporus DSM 14697]